jgi:hypothetical protein
MRIEHRVPLVGQITDNLCWFAAFQMLEGWHNGLLPKRATAFTAAQIAYLKSKNWGVQPSSVKGFAKFTGMTIKMATPDAAGVEGLLTTYGPLWYPAQNNGYLPVGTHHVVVIRGIDNGNLLINDPSPVGHGGKHVIPAATFFKKLQPLSNQFLVMLANSKPDVAAIYNELGVR